MQQPALWGTKPPPPVCRALTHPKHLVSQPDTNTPCLTLHMSPGHVYTALSWAKTSFVLAAGAGLDAPVVFHKQIARQQTTESTLPLDVILSHSESNNSYTAVYF